MENWKSFENTVKTLFDFDNAILTPGSGNSKKEEDVIGEDLIIQCKCTENENVTLLKKDIDRLLLSAKSLDKFPVFMNKTKTYTTLTLIVDSKILNLFQMMLYPLKLYNYTMYLSQNLKSISYNILTLLKSKLDKYCGAHQSKIREFNTKYIITSYNKLDSDIDNYLYIDLFEDRNQKII